MLIVHCKNLSSALCKHSLSQRKFHYHKCSGFAVTELSNKYYRDSNKTLKRVHISVPFLIIYGADLTSKLNKI